MAGASGSLHEREDKLSPEVIDRHRAIVSIMEELEAVDWYDQRAAATSDPELKAILEHNRDEEKEHALMTLEWLRRRDPKMDEEMRTYLLKEGPILKLEEAATGEGGDTPAAEDTGAGGSLRIGSLREEG
ncbi:MAG: ferritin [Alphaproteobacteria bacterium]|nr:ferritin [Alphaproteobacteria bacterium]